MRVYIHARLATSFGPCYEFLNMRARARLGYLTCMCMYVCAIEFSAEQGGKAPQAIVVLRMRAMYIYSHSLEGEMEVLN